MIPVDLQHLQDAAFVNACAKGWHARPLAPDGVVDHDRVLAKLALIHSELGEAWEAWNAGHISMRHVDGKPEGFVVEIADAVIRVLDLCGALGIALAPCVWPTWPVPQSHHIYFGVHEEQLRARHLIDQTTEAVRADNWPEFARHLGELLNKLSVICHVNKLDLSAAISAKMLYNTTRPHRHGDKHA